jgi:hypothetical protein
MLPKVRPYLPEDFNAWLDLTAISSIELNEEFLIWNERPQLPPKSISFVLEEEKKIVASIDLVPLDNENKFLAKHWFVRKPWHLDFFSDFLNKSAQLANGSVRIWVNSFEVIQLFLAQPGVAVIENRITFFVEGKFLPNNSQNIGFCDHIYGICAPEDYPEVLNKLPFANKSIMVPKFQTCLEISLP